MKPHILSAETLERIRAENKRSTDFPLWVKILGGFLVVIDLIAFARVAL